MSGFYLSIWIDNKLGKFDENKQASKSISQLTTEVIFHICLLGILCCEKYC